MPQHIVVVRHTALSGPSQGSTSFQSFGPFERQSEAYRAEDTLRDQYHATPVRYDGHPCESSFEVMTLTAWRR